MGLKSGGLQRKSKASQEIPSSSMADIAFLLLIFFMVTTVFQKDKKRDIEWPEAEAAEKMDDKQKDILNIWVEVSGEVYINDQLWQMEDVRSIVRPLYAENTSLVISLRSDQNVRYQYIDLVQKELQAAGALRVVFATELEQDITRERR
ncbi:MAG: biopolymer transporter ExbD [Gemmatimonadetes bacterium]|nr:biopolymer transporter ExbD [Gemmatimonadota bacterium]MYH53067.1 biopolymer transporter ExbD [Gemmatimonadota bacterium]MYK67290.1 biopolymer transporter ExbD [Gemmatimonadota bacterium]